jgi:hypothetical protein
VITATNEDYPNNEPGIHGMFISYKISLIVSDV